MKNIAESSFQSNKKTYSLGRNLRLVESADQITEDGGLVLFSEFAERIGLKDALRKVFPEEENKSNQQHAEADLIFQSILQYAAGHLIDKDANTFRENPILIQALGKKGASQPTFSRFWNRASEEDAEKIDQVLETLRETVYQHKKPEKVIIELDSTLIDTSGKQEEAKYNVHYSSVGYHPLVSFTADGDLLGVKLRSGTMYCSNGATEFLESIIEMIEKIAPGVPISFRADSGFAAPEIYELLEKKHIQYTIKLKKNPVLHEPLTNVTVNLMKMEITREHVLYGEFSYAAGSWNSERRVLFAGKRPRGTFLVDYQFIVTNMDITPEEGFAFYSDRGNSENFIKELKEDYAVSLPHKTMKANAFHFAVQALAYALMAWFKSLCLPEELAKAQSKTIRTQVIRTAVRVTHSGRYTNIKISKYAPNARQFFQIAEKVRKVRML